MSGYRVLIVIKDQWWSDGQSFPRLADARRYRHEVAAKWSDCDTAIASPRNEVLFYRDSLIEQRKFAELCA